MLELSEKFVINEKPFTETYNFGEDERKLSDKAVAAYVALRSLIGFDDRKKICVSANQLCFELYGNGHRTTSDLTKMKEGLAELCNTPLLSLISMDDRSNYILDVSRLYTSDISEDYYIGLYRDEIWTIFNAREEVDSYKLLRYFLCILASIDVNTTYQYSNNQAPATNFIGNSPLVYLAVRAGISDKTCFAYNNILEREEILYVKRTYLINIAVSSSDSTKTIPAHYGRFKDKEPITRYAKEMERKYMRDGAYRMPLFGNLKKSMDTKYKHLSEGKKYSYKEMMVMCAFFQSYGEYIDFRINSSSSDEMKKLWEKKKVLHPLCHDFIENNSDRPDFENDYDFLLEEFRKVFAKERSVRVKNITDSLGDKEKEVPQDSEAEVGEGET